MTFEEALHAMRKGSKIRHPTFEPDVYFIACRMGIMFCEITDDEPLSIVKMQGDYEHEDMGRSQSLEHIPKDFDKVCKHGRYPQLNLFLVMADNWEIVE